MTQPVVRTHHQVPVGEKFLKFGRVDNKKHQHQMHDYGDPEGLALLRTLQLVLELDQQRRNVVHLPIGRLPASRVIKVTALWTLRLWRGGGTLRRYFSGWHRNRWLSRLEPTPSPLVAGEQNFAP